MDRAARADDEHATYDRTRSPYFAAATQAALVLAEFRAPYRGRSTPVNAWWGSFDLAVNMFSGRPAEPPSTDYLFRNAMDSEEVAVGWWPGDGRYGKAAFYAYAHPAREGFADARSRPRAGTRRSASTSSTGTTFARAPIPTRSPSTSLGQRFATPARYVAGTALWPPAPREHRRRWRRASSEVSVSGGEPAAGLLHGRQRSLRLRQRTGAHVDARRLGGDRDLLAGGGIASGALLRGRLDANGQLNDPTDATFSAFPSCSRTIVSSASTARLASALLNRRGRRQRSPTGPGLTARHSSWGRIVGMDWRIQPWTADGRAICSSPAAPDRVARQRRHGPTCSRITGIDA